MRVAEIFMNPSILNLKENIMNNAHAQTGKMVVAKVQTLANKNRIATPVASLSSRPPMRFILVIEAKH